VPDGARKTPAHQAALLILASGLIIQQTAAQTTRLQAPHGKQETLPAGCETGACVGIYQKFSNKIF
jgi:hypothetical protein